MDGIGGAIVILRVAAVAVGRQGGVIVVHVAVGTGHLDVETGKRKRSSVVVKRPVGPESSVVAELTGGWETYLTVVNRRRRVVVILEVAGGTSGVGARQTIVIVEMAVRADAWRHQM
jgi:hypothetical protein